LRWILFALIVVALLAVKVLVVTRVAGWTCGQRSAGEGPNKVYEFYVRIPTTLLWEICLRRLRGVMQRRRSWADLHAAGG
jgi:hypothetical protein